MFSHKGQFLTRNGCMTQRVEAIIVLLTKQQQSCVPSDSRTNVASNRQAKPSTLACEIPLALVWLHFSFYR